MSQEDCGAVVAVNKVFGVYANASKMVKVGSHDSVFINNFQVQVLSIIGGNVLRQREAGREEGVSNCS